LVEIEPLKTETKSPVVLSLKNENSSMEVFELSQSVGENSTNGILFKPTPTTIQANTNQLAVQKPSYSIKDDPKKAQQFIVERKSSRSEQSTDQATKPQNFSLNGENFSFKSSSECLNDETKAHSSKNLSKQTTPPSECYFYLVKPNFISSTNNGTFEISQLQSPTENKITFESSTDQSDNNLKSFLENCLEQLSKNNKIESSSSANLENSSNATNNSNNRTSPIASFINNSTSNTQLLMDSPSLVLSDTPRLSLVRKQKTVVEKMPDSNETSFLPTNTYLLNGENINDLNDFYSLKITFV
jgi:hypothetical protein